MVPTVHIKLDPRRCSGFASCELIAPDVFVLEDDTGRAVLRSEAAEVERLAVLEEAARSCPTGAICVEEKS